jgi:hypothetical protein
MKMWFSFHQCLCFHHKLQFARVLNEPSTINISVVLVKHFKNFIAMCFYEHISYTKTSKQAEKNNMGMGRGNI